MKNKKEIDALIKEQVKVATDKLTPPAQEKRSRKRITFLRFVLKYLQTKPSEEFVKEELSKVVKMLETRAKTLEKLLDENFKDTNYSFDGVKTFTDKFNKENGVKGLEENKKTLEFILSAN